MADTGDDPLSNSTSPELSKTAFYESPRKAQEKIGTYFEGWSAKLTDTSLQMCYALIGANWVVFGSVGGILNSIWAKLSLFCVLLMLGVNVIGAWAMTEALRRRFNYAESNGPRWDREFNEAANKKSAWPSTDKIDGAAIFLRNMKGLLPVLGGILLIIGAVRK